MKLNDILQLNEGPLPDWFKPKELTDEEIVEWCKTNALGFLKNKRHIFRGINTPGKDATGLLDTSIFKRRSISSNGLYNQWIDNHPAWSAYPKRSKSLICTTSRIYSQNYGDTYVIIPADDAKIGVCPNEDIWDSFYLGFISTEQIMLNELVDELQLIGVDPTSWATIKATSERITSDTRIKNRDKVTYPFVKGLLSALHNWNNLYEALERVFDPVKNKFGYTTGNEFRIGGNREVWVSGNAIQITIPRFNNIINKVFESGNNQ